MPDLIGQSLGRYHILEQLGEGGMAIVYKAYDTRLERDVAVKIIRRGAFPPEQLERILKRFEREAKALARLTHPNIVPVIDYGEYKKSPYLVMPYLPGKTLKQRLGKPMPWQEAVRILLPVAQALAYSHDHNIIHRDIKPSNILLTENNQPMLSDFGIAKILDLEDGQTLTATGVGLGTPEYMSPEQGMGKLVGPSTDIYSLGIVLYELLTGRKPYTADTPMAVVFKHMHDPPPSPRQFVPGIPEVVEKVLLKALAKQPEDRFVDMNAFANALERLLAGVIVSVPVGMRNLRSETRKEDLQKESLAHKQRLDSMSTSAQAATRDELAPAAAPKTQELTSNPPSDPGGQIVNLSNRPIWKRWIQAAVLVGLLGIGLVLGSGLLKLGQHGQGPLAGLATQTPTPTLTSTKIPTRTSTNTPTSTHTLTVTPSPTSTSSFTHQGDYEVTVRYLEGNISYQLNQLIERLGYLGYKVELEPNVDMKGWMVTQNAIFYGTPSCLDAIKDILLYTKDVVNLSTLSVSRFPSYDGAYDQLWIIIQLADNSFIP